MDAAWETANTRTMTSRFGPVDAVWVGMLLAMVLSMKKEMAEAVHKKVA